MPLNLTGRHLTISDELRQYVQSKVERYHRFAERISLIEVTLTQEKSRIEADILVKAGRFDIKASETAPELRVAFDNASDKIVKQLEKRKKRMIDRKKHASDTIATLQPAEAGSFTRAGLPTWVHPEAIDLKPCTLDEALENLNALAHRQFYVFRHALTDNINVIFKRNDGLIGLIET